jgi:hypothetical protein
MNKANYLKRNVKFVDFLKKVIKGEVPINHSYLDEAFCFESLESAFDSYVFPFSSNSKNTYKRDPVKWRAKYDAKLFPSNKAKLEVIKKCLHDEFNKEGANDELFFEAIKKGLFWGATGEVNVPTNTKRKGTYSANVQWIEQNYNLYDGLTSNFKCAVNEIESDDFDDTLFGKEKLYRMNAGFTKIYALLANDSIIYDGRVGAALGYIVTLFCEQTGEEFTEDLNFYWGASESKGRFRNPSIPEKGFNFTKLSNSNESGWALCNVKANWLLTSAIDKLEDSFKFGGYGKKDMLHAIEASLFMVGYDFPQYLPIEVLSDKAVIISKYEGKPITKPKANDIRKFAVELITENLEKSEIFEFTSSIVRESIGGDLTAICHALKMTKFFNARNIAIEVIDAPPSGLGKVTYQATLMT